jgi:hypothetical protein
MEATLVRILVPPPPPLPTGFDTMFEGDAVAPEPLVAPPLDESWEARVSHEFFNRPAPFYGMEESLLSLFLNFFRI